MVDWLSWVFALRDRLPFYRRRPANIYGREAHKHDHEECCSDCGRKMWSGEWVFWDEPSYEYGETDPYCLACTKRHQRELDAIDWEALAREELQS